MRRGPGRPVAARPLRHDPGSRSVARRAGRRHDGRSSVCGVPARSQQRGSVVHRLYDHPDARSCPGRLCYVAGGWGPGCPTTGRSTRPLPPSGRILPRPRCPPAPPIWAAPRPCSPSRRLASTLWCSGNHRERPRTGAWPSARYTAARSAGRQRDHGSAGCLRRAVRQDFEPQPRRDIHSHDGARRVAIPRARRTPTW